MATHAQPNAYLKTKILTASPAQLRGMLLDGAVRFAQRGRDGLAKRDYEEAYNGIHRCQQILMELLEALDPAVDRELCERLTGLYVFLYTQLIKATTERDATIVDEVIRLLEFEAETWRMLMDRLNDPAADRVAQPAAAAASASDGNTATPIPGATLSVRG